MKLAEYMRVNKLTLKKMEAKTGIDFRVIHRYVSGSVLPSIPNAIKIFKGTNKKVNLIDWDTTDEKKN